MVRTIVGLLAALLFVAGLSLGAEDKKDAKKPKTDTVIGKFESYKDETLKLKVKGEDTEFKVPGNTPVGYSAGKDKLKVLKAKEHLKDVKKGSIVAVTLDGKKVLGVGVVVSELPNVKPKKADKKEK
ncbi:MAG: hypothetical protein ACRELG_02020 [Gemmataceae bacterium]